MATLTDLHYVNIGVLDQQLNLYGVGIIRAPYPRMCTVVAVTIGGKVRIIENQSGGSPCSWSDVEVPFSGLNSLVDDEVEVVSNHAFAWTREDGSVAPVIVIAFLRLQPHGRRMFLHVYGLNSRVGDDWCSVGEDVFVMELQFIPFVLSHVNVPGMSGPVVLLSGSDCKVHAYEMQEQENLSWIMTECAEHPIPEIATVPSSVLALDIVQTALHRVVAIGCQSGLIQLNITGVGDAPSPTRTYKTVVDGPVSSLVLFYPRVADRLMAQKLVPSEVRELPKIHLACGAAMGFACIFRNVLVKHLSDINHLEQSECFDGVMGITAIDIDFDGRMEICVTTYGHQLLVYHEQQDAPTPQSVTPTQTPRPRRHKRVTGFMAERVLTLPHGAGVSTDVLEGLVDLAGAPLPTMTAAVPVAVPRARVRSRGISSRTSNDEALHVTLPPAQVPDATHTTSAVPVPIPKDEPAPVATVTQSVAGLGVSVMGTSPPTAHQHLRRRLLAPPMHPAASVSHYTDSAIADTDSDTENRTSSLSKPITSSPFNHPVSRKNMPSGDSRTPPSDNFDSHPDQSSASDLNSEDEDFETIGQMKRELSQPELQSPVPLPEDIHYELHNSRYFTYPLYRVAALDMTGDGIDEIMVTGLHGLHFLQVDPRAVNATIAARLRQLNDTCKET